jgi:hypothetical protein
MIHADGGSSNRLFDDAASLITGGVVVDDKQAVAASQTLLQTRLAKQLRDGVFPEDGGYDSSYQGVSLMDLIEIAAVNGKAGLMPAITLGVRWEESRMTSAGAILVAGNTRTGLGPEIFRAATGNAKFIKRGYPIGFAHSLR